MKPNILYLHSHDTGRHISPYGFPVSSPNLQQFAAQSTLFRNAFCAAPTCSPSRAALLMGNAPHCNGMMGLAHRGWRCHDYSRHIVSTLAGAGYASAQCGIEHIAAPVYDAKIETASARARDVAPSAARWIENAPAQMSGPFFLDVGFVETHTLPHSGNGLCGCGEGDASFVQPPAPFPNVRPARQDYADFMLAITELDWGMGQVLSALDRTGLGENTIVIVTTDHGAPFPGMKCNLTEMGAGVMLMVRGPGFEAGKVVDPMVSHLDLYPTICQSVEIETPAWCQGSSLLPLVKGEVEELHDELFFEVTHHAAYEPQRGVRTERYKYIRRFEPRDAPVLPNVDDCRTKHFWHDNGWPSRLYGATQLYDLWVDPREADDLSGDANYADVEADLSARLETWMRETNDPILDGPIAVPDGTEERDVDAYSPSPKDEADALLKWR